MAGQVCRFFFFFLFFPLSSHSNCHHLPDGVKPRDDKDASGRQPVLLNDPLAGMSEADRWSLKGLRVLMHNYPDYNSLVTGFDPTTLGLDLSSPEYVLS